MTEKKTEMKSLLFSAAIEAGRNALRAGLIINGASSVSMLTFVGSVAGLQYGSTVIRSLSTSLFLFVSGVLFCALSAGLNYVVQTIFYYGYGRDKKNNSATILNYLAIFGVFMSYVLFAVGTYKAYLTFLSWPLSVSP